MFEAEISDMCLEFCVGLAISFVLVLEEHQRGQTGTWGPPIMRMLLVSLSCLFLAPARLVLLFIILIFFLGGSR